MLTAHHVIAFLVIAVCVLAAVLALLAYWRRGSGGAVVAHVLALAQTLVVAQVAFGLLLLADPDHAVAEKYGVWGERKFAGKTYMGINRSTFLIDADGKVARAMLGIKPAGHASEVLDSLP